ncbi:IscS subfamily cysteine desulfurase [Hydrocarboniclastica marina]|uniref:cysteine desulfurase n=1 Tax=Hydrocarboniclastica marina TaxID=2259620 RepID=A0A4P7XHY6_9ALTE|nr:IscS subfamily cysteine desulfurase [Hydrocarboniclastica marina]MAL98363.1 IscS subfamily cysteine desulfurase [Alteromonadaceae bacterium]QCF25872.1 IscS subfamily cysteine desulfurase [Hydrocarboniclastica marina]|tara:strand:+ start:347 stop:1513 length:1167 start_codon:yes stop_codon:yes gene_type:complete
MTALYLDYAATTPADPAVIQAMLGCLGQDGVFGNPASRSHGYGWQAEAAVETARQQVALFLNADSREIVWTSGATEADNLAIKGAAAALQTRGRHLISSVTEHKAVLDSLSYLETQGFEVTWLRPDDSGMITADQVLEVVRTDTILVSLMLVNNETGVVNALSGLGHQLRSRNILFHIDAAQAPGKIAVDVKALGVDLLSLSAHKVYGPKGIGALYVRRAPEVQIQAQMHGGGHERGMRSGTLPTHQVVGMGEAFRIARECRETEAPRVERLGRRFLDAVLQIEGVSLNGRLRVPNIMNLTFAGVDGETLLLALSDLAVSSGSACASASMSPSYVLKSMGLTDEQAHSSLRFSIGRFTTEAEIDRAADLVGEILPRLRERRRARTAQV